MQDGKPQIHLAGKVPFAGRLDAKSICSTTGISGVSAEGLELASLEGIMVCAVGAKADARELERKRLRSIVALRLRMLLEWL